MYLDVIAILRHTIHPLMYELYSYVLSYVEYVNIHIGLRASTNIYLVPKFILWRRCQQGKISNSTDSGHKAPRS